MLLKELEQQFNLSHGTIWDIVYERLGYRKVCSRWVPRQLTEDHKKNRMGASLTNLLRFNDNGEDFLEQIITGDETWIHQYCPEKKRNPWHGSIQCLPPSKNSRHQPALGNCWRLCFGTCRVCFCCTLPILMKQTILLLIRPLSRNLGELFNARGLRC